MRAGPRFGSSAFGCPLAWALGGLALLFASRAEARECTSPQLNSCINSDTFWPNPGPSRFATVAGTETVAPGKVSFGLVTTYQSRPIRLHIASPGPGGSDRNVIDDQVTGNFLFAYGVTGRLQLDFALPTTFVQSGTGASPLTGGASLSDTAMRDLRFGVAYALVPRVREAVDTSSDASSGASSGGRGPGRAWSVTTRFALSAPTGAARDFAGERTAVFVPSIAADYRVRRFFFGAEFSARIRPVTEFAGARVGTELGLGLGAGYDLLDRENLSVLAEARGYYNVAEQHDVTQSTFGLTSQPNGTHIIPAEWFVGLRSAPVLGGDVAFFGGGGGPIPTGDAAVTTPRFRFILGAVYAPLDRDSDHDGVPDAVDLCPQTAGVRKSERPGCPQDPEEAPSPLEPKVKP